MALPRSAQVYADFLLPHLSPATRLLDVGCGSGELSLGLATEVGWLTGVDADPEEITAARARAGVSGVPNADFEVGDVYALAAAGALRYGTADSVAEFGRDRAEDCRDDWYVSSAIREGLAAPADLEAMRAALLEWSQSNASYAAFAWCRAVGWKDEPAG
jgi:SAM-dependent methyltransferase